MVPDNKTNVFYKSNIQLNNESNICSSGLKGETKFAGSASIS